MINYLDNIGFGYSSVKGQGGVRGWLASLEKQGHSQMSVMCAAMDAVDALGKGKDHVGYLMSHITEKRYRNEKHSMQWAWKVLGKLKEMEFDLSGYSEAEMASQIYKILNETECETKELTDICWDAVYKNVQDQVGYMMDELVNRGYSWGT